MPISSLHPEYATYFPKWERCRDVIEGTDQVKAKGTKYLPALSDQTTAEYSAYRARGVFVNMTKHILEGMVGMALRRSASYTYPKGMEEYFIDVTSTGVSFHEMLKWAVSEILLMGRIGLMADRKMDGRMYVATYTAENIINWFKDETGRLTGVVLKEHILSRDEAKDPFEQSSTYQFRYVYLTDDGAVVDVYNDKNELVSSTQLINRGSAVDRLPFVFINPFGVSYDVVKPPMLDIVDINLSHYRTSCDLEHGRHFTALPTPVVIGVDASSKLKIGSTTAWVLPEPNSDAKFLEFIGAGLGSLENALSEKQAQISQFSARLMDTSSKGSEAVEAVRLRYAAEAATLGGIISAVENGVNVLYRYIAEAEGMAEGIDIKLNRDFLESRLSAAEMKVLLDAEAQGRLPEGAFIEALVSGEMISPSYLNTEISGGNDES